MPEKTYRFYIRQGEFELDLEGDQAFVESYLEAFFEGEATAARAAVAKGPRTVKAMPPARAKGKAKARGDGKRAESASVVVDGAALAAHFKGRRVKNHKERILAFLGFLTASGTKEFGAGHLVACFAASGVRFPAAGRQYFQILKKQGLVAKGSKWGFWKLTEKGAAAAAAAGKAAPRKRKKARRKAAPKRKAAAKAPAAKKAAAKKPKRKAPATKAAKAIAPRGKGAAKRRAPAKRKAAPKAAAPPAPAPEPKG